MVQRRSAIPRTLRDFSPTSCTSAPSGYKHQLEKKQQQQKKTPNNLQSRRTSDKVCMMYKLMNGLVDVNHAAGLLEPRNRSSRGEAQIPIPSPPLRNKHLHRSVHSSHDSRQTYKYSGQTFVRFAAVSGVGNIGLYVHRNY